MVWRVGGEDKGEEKGLWVALFLRLIDGWVGGGLSLDARLLSLFFFSSLGVEGGVDGWDGND